MLLNLVLLHLVWKLRYSDRVIFSVRSSLHLLLLCPRPSFQDRSALHPLPFLLISEEFRHFTRLQAFLDLVDFSIHFFQLIQ